MLGKGDEVAATVGQEIQQLSEQQRVGHREDLGLDALENSIRGGCNDAVTNSIQGVTGGTDQTSGGCSLC